MQLNQLKFLVTVARCGSINKASEVLFVSQPAISRAIRELEKELGVQLLIRTKNGAEPTEYGAKIIGEANNLLYTIGKWSDLAEATNGNRVVKISYFSEFGSQSLFRFFFLMKDLHPDIEIKLEMHRTPLNEIDSDDAIIHTCSSDSLNKTIYNSNRQYRVTKLYEDVFCLFIHSEHPLAKKEMVKLTDLVHLAIMGKTSGKSFPFRNILSDLQCPVLSLGDNENILRAVSQNRGGALMPRSAAVDNPYITAGQICCKQFSDAAFPLYHYLLTPVNKVLTASENTVLNCMRTLYDTGLNSFSLNTDRRG